MKIKATCVIFLLALMAICGLLQACVEAQPDFAVVSLKITPAKVVTGEKATIMVEIRNNDAKEATYNVPLMVNGVADDRRSVTLAPGATELLTFKFSRSTPGSYNISVGSWDSKLEIEKPAPAAFVISSLEVSPTEIDVMDSITVSAEIANIGGTQGSYTADLKIDGTSIETREITIPAGGDNKLVFNLCQCSPGTYTVALGNLTSQFVVNEIPMPVIIPVTNNEPSQTYPTSPPVNTCRTKG